MQINYPDTPKGKRAVRINIWGNIVGYVSGFRFWEFGTNNYTNRCIAEAWLAGKTLKEANES